MLLWCTAPAWTQTFPQRPLRIIVAFSSGTAADIEIQAREILYLRSKMNQLMALHTGQPVATIEKDVDRDHYMSADEAKAYGLIDAVLTPTKSIAGNGAPKLD